MKRVLVTGASSPIGASALKYLHALDFDIHCLGRTPSCAGGATFHQLDLLREDPSPLLEKILPSHLLHLAWHCDRDTIWNSRCNLDWIEASLTLLSGFQRAGGVRAVCAGSAAEYDWTAPILDDAAGVLHPATVYGYAKLTTWRLLAETPMEPVSLGWARIFFSFGPKDAEDRLLAQVIDSLVAGRSVSCTAGSQVRPFIYVEDVAAALASFLDSPVQGPVNIALDEVCSVRELALMAARIVGGTSKIVFGARDVQAGEPQQLRASTRRLRDEVGFVPRHSIEEGVRSTVSLRIGAALGYRYPSFKPSPITLLAARRS